MDHYRLYLCLIISRPFILSVIRLDDLFVRVKEGLHPLDCFIRLCCIRYIILWLDPYRFRLSVNTGGSKRLTFNCKIIFHKRFHILLNILRTHGAVKFQQPPDDTTVFDCFYDTLVNRPNDIHHLRDCFCRAFPEHIICVKVLSQMYDIFIRKCPGLSVPVLELQVQVSSSIIYRLRIYAGNRI